MPLHGCIVTCTLHLYALELHGIQVCGVECHALVVNSVDFSSALKTTPSSSGRSRHAPAPVQGKKQKPHKRKNRQKRWSLSKGRACWSPWNTCAQKTALLASRSTKVPIVPGGPSCIFTRACVAVSILNIARTASMRFCSRAFGPCLRCDVKTRPAPRAASPHFRKSTIQCNLRNSAPDEAGNRNKEELVHALLQCISEQEASWESFP